MNTSQQLKAGYKKVEGDVPRAWSAKRLIDVIKDIGDGGTPPRSKREYFSRDIPWVVVEDIEREIFDTKEHLSELGLRNSSANLWPKNTLILSFGATIGEVGIAKVPVATKQGIAGIVPNLKYTTPEFLYYLFQFNKPLLLRYAHITTISEVRPPTLRELAFPFPPLREQEKIAEILSTVDDAIQKTEEVIAKAEELKKGLMQQLLTKGIGHRKFKKTKIGEIPEEWKMVRLEEIGSSEKYAIVDGPFGSSVNTEKDYIKSGVPVIRINNIAPSKFIEDGLKYVSEEKFESLRRSAVKPGDILLSKVGTIGYACILPDHIPKAVLSTTGSCKITISKDKVVAQFVCCYLNHIKPYMDRIASESVQPFLNMKTVKNLPLVIPPLHEQREIAEILSIADAKLDKEMGRKEKLEELKKGLMQVLLTGAARVKV